MVCGGHFINMWKEQGLGARQGFRFGFCNLLAAASSVSVSPSTRSGESPFGVLKVQEGNMGKAQYLAPEKSLKK